MIDKVLSTLGDSFFCTGGVLQLGVIFDHFQDRIVELRAVVVDIVDNLEVV